MNQEERTNNPERGLEVRAFRTGREEHSANQEDGKLQDCRNNRGRDELSTDRTIWLLPDLAIHGAPMKTSKKHGRNV